MFEKGPEILFSVFFFFLASLQFPTIGITIQKKFFFLLKQTNQKVNISEIGGKGGMWMATVFLTPNFIILPATNIYLPLLFQFKKTDSPIIS
jgi:hypothetical protein